MKLRAIRLFADAAGTRNVGDVYEEVDSVAAFRIKAGLAEPVKEGPETAALDTEHVEQAVMPEPEPIKVDRRRRKV